MTWIRKERYVEATDGFWHPSGVRNWEVGGVIRGLRRPASGLGPLWGPGLRGGPVWRTIVPFVRARWE